MFENALTAGLTSTGMSVLLLGPVPTPAVGLMPRSMRADLGVMISASHNPAEDNGIKVFSGRGEKFGETTERAVEAIIADHSWHVPSGTEAHVQVEDLIEPYLAHTRLLLPDARELTGARIAVDMANGSTTTTARRLFEGLGFSLVTLGDTPDGRNINEKCGSTHPAGLAAAVVNNGCRMGVAFDGDGDRAILVDHRGQIVDGDALLLMLGLHYQRQHQLIGNTVVATVMSNIGLEIALRDRGVDMLRTPVGDKYVSEAMLRDGYVVGGEQSGHVILAEHLFTGDGMATALAVMRVMAESGRELADLAADLVTFPQTLVNVRVREKVDVATIPAVAEAMQRVEQALAGRGRLLVRYSGTEPLLRIMIEGENQATVQAWAEEVADAVRKTIA